MPSAAARCVGESSSLPPAKMQVERVQLPKLSSGHHRAPALLWLFGSAVFGLTSFLQICFLPFAVPSLPARYHPTTMSEAAAADADTTKVNLVSFSSAVSICLCGVSPSEEGGRVESATSNPREQNRNRRREAGGSFGIGRLCPALFGPDRSRRCFHTFQGLRMGDGPAGLRVGWPISS